VFLETKVWISDYGYDATLHAFDRSARKLWRRPQLVVIDALDTGVRRGPEPDSITLETYGREIPEA
jgi:diketogulonate reductase-like aldo/keto reductase